MDLADYLLTWRSGRIATLYTLPFDAEPVVSSERGCALNILLSPDPDMPAPLGQIDRYASRCADTLRQPDGDMVVTTADRLDGRTGLVDLLVIRR